MIKKQGKDIIEGVLISVVWLAPAVRTAFDYRQFISFISYLLMLIVFLTINRKGFAFVSAVFLLAVACFIDDTSFFTFVAPVIMLYINRYFLNVEKPIKKVIDTINPFLTGTALLFIIQVVLLFIKTPVDFEVFWKSKVIDCGSMLLIVLLIPFVFSFKKIDTKAKKEEISLFRIICLFAVFGIAVTTAHYISGNGFYNYEYYMLSMYPWVIFVYSFINNNKIYKTVFLHEIDNKIEKIIVG